MKKIYGVNNYSGAQIDGINGSVYDLRSVFDQITFLEEEPQIETHPILPHLMTIANINRRTFEFADQILSNDDTPIMVGGDHSIAIGTVSATSKHFPDLGLIWIDAHADINTIETSPSGNIHGMPIASLLGFVDPHLDNIGNQNPKIKPEKIVYLGLRSVDEGEVELIKKLNIKAYYYDEIEKLGLENVLNQVKEYLQTTDIHLSFDLDSMDPTLISGVSTPVTSGFNHEEVDQIFDFMKSNFNIRSFDFVEYNKLNDTDHKTLNTLIHLIHKIL